MDLGEIAPRSSFLTQPLFDLLYHAVAVLLRRPVLG
jgi:hypothetical protein